MPPGVDYGEFFFSDYFVEPFPCFGVYGFADCAEYAEAAEVVFVYPFFAEFHEHSDGCWGGVEYGYVVSFDHVPPAVFFGVVGCAFEEEGRDAKR